MRLQPSRDIATIEPSGSAECPQRRLSARWDLARDVSEEPDGPPDGPSSRRRIPIRDLALSLANLLLSWLITLRNRGPQK